MSANFKFLIVFALSFGLGLRGYSQLTIIGPVEVASGSSSCYATEVSCGTITWTTTVGTINNPGGGCIVGPIPPGDAFTQTKGLVFPTTTTILYGYVQASGSCAGSGSLNIRVIPPLINNVTITPASQSVYCGSPVSALVSSAPSGGDGTNTYLWQSSPDNSTWSTISGAAGSSYTPPVPSATGATYYHVKISSFTYSVTSASTLVTVTTPPLAVGTLSPVSQSINYNTVPASISCPGATGGNCSPLYTYQWLQSTDNVTFVDAGNSTLTKAFSLPLAQTMYYELKATETNSGNSVYSGKATVTVYPLLQPGTVTPSTQAIGYYAIPAGLSLTGVSGGNSLYSYKWQSSPDNVTYTDIFGATSATYAPSNLTVSSYFRAVVTSNNVSSFSVPALISVRQQIIPGTLLPNNLNIPTGSSPGLLTSDSASGGACGGSYTYQWQSSANGTTWSSIGGVTSLVYNPGNLTSSTYYRLQVICGPDTVYSNWAQIMVSALVTDLNYIRVRDLVKPAITDLATANGLSNNIDVHQTTQYFDGLGRLMQTVAQRASPRSTDMITVNLYDPFGREPTKYLPYISSTTDGNYKSTAFNGQYVFNSTQFPGEQYYYTQTTYESSPLDRVSATYGAGLNWVGNNRGVTSQYMVNTLSDSVRIWTIGAIASNLPVTSILYPAGQLYKNITKDESGHQVVEFKDKDGNMILKKVQLASTPGIAHVGWLNTYYVYDDLNNLRFVVPPRAVELINANWIISQQIADELCFRYVYDLRNRMIIKKIPGAGEVWVIYDQWDRTVLTQDANMRTSNQWLYYKYDAQNRQILKGFYADSTHSSQASMQAYLTTQNMARFETYQTVSFPLYSSSLTFPPVSQALTVTYYDDYSWTGWYGAGQKDNTYDNQFLTASNTIFPYPQALTQSNCTRGLVTQLLDYTSTTNPLATETIYDDHGRVIQSIYSNYGAGHDVTTIQHDFTGKTLRSYLKQQKGGARLPQTHYVMTKLDYDGEGRLLHTWKNIDSAATDQLIDSMQYDDLSQVRTKYLGNSVDNIVYDYNIRGWVTGINKDFVSGAAPNHYFGMELGYDKATAAVATTSYKGLQYNGNIAGMLWKSAGDGVCRQYDFTYDNVNRLIGADFNQQFGAAWGKSSPSSPAFTMDFSVSNLTYDANGNIGSMKQNGFKIGGSGAIDDLTYTYSFNSSASTNKLSVVIDAANDPNSKLGDFHYPTGKVTTGDYTYDANGNLTSDLNKGVTNITYNYLNLPTVISFTHYRYIYYFYDDAGNKLEKIVTDPTPAPALRVETRYMSGVVYQNDTISYIGHEEGRVRWAFHKYLNGNTSNAYEYDFMEKDHLGDTRMLLSQEKDTAQYMATMEAAYRTTEKALFYNVDSCSYAASLVPGGYPADGTTSPNDSVARVNGTLHKMGPAILLKMMSGDSVSFGVKSFYRSGGTVGNPNSSFTSVLNALAGGLVTMTGASHGALTDLTNAATTPVYNEISNFISTRDTVIPSKPKSYLNWMLLDNQFNYVSSGGQSGAKPIGTADALNALTGHFKLKNSGYLYIWVSNETPNWDVFFDNLSIQTFTGPMLEENHYYPFGLTMAGISDKALKTQYAENKYRYNKGSELQNKEFADGSGLEMYETQLRELDPQLGRWWQIDPKTDESHEDVSPYNAMNDDPERFNDPLGDEGQDDASEAECCKTLTNIGNAVGAIGQVLGNQMLHIAGQVARNVLNSAAGVEIGAISNMTGGAVPASPIFTSGYSDADYSVFNGGAQASQLVSMLVDPGAGLNSHPGLQLAPVEGVPFKVAESHPALLSSRVDAHGNDKTNTHTQHGYEITDNSTGDVHKYGISGKPLNKNGTSSRANLQVNKLNKPGQNRFSARVVKQNMLGRQKALNWEKGKVKAFKKTNAQNKNPTGNILPNVN